MAKVLLHTKTQTDPIWKDELCEFARIPIAGEFLDFGSKSSWFQVKIIIHTLFDCGYVAEAFAEEEVRGSVATKSQKYEKLKLSEV